MSFASLLSQVRKDKRGTTSTPSRPPPSSSSSSAPSSDPAVARLKEARRKEKERLEELKRSKKLEKAASDAYMQPRSHPQSAPRSNSSKTHVPPPHRRDQPKQQRSGGSTHINTGRQNNNAANRTQKSASPPGPKLSFKELLKQAEKVDAKKLTVNPIIKKQETKSERSKSPGGIIPRSKSLTDGVIPRSSSPRNVPPDITKKPVKLVSTQRDNDPYGINRRRPNELVQSRFDVKQPIVAPAPFAKPSEKLSKKLEMRRRSPASQPHQRPGGAPRPSSTIRKEKKDAYDIEAVDDDDDDEDLYQRYNDYEDQADDFIEYDDDDEEMEERARQQRIRKQGYDRDEIWEIMNPGRSRESLKRRYYDDDEDDDMEATGEEIFEEEERAAKLARLDDIREQRLLEQRALEKQKRLKRGN